MHLGALDRRHVRPRAVVERPAGRGDRARRCRRAMPSGTWPMTSSVAGEITSMTSVPVGCDPLAADVELLVRLHTYSSKVVDDRLEDFTARPP